MRAGVLWAHEGDHRGGIPESTGAGVARRGRTEHAEALIEGSRAVGGYFAGLIGGMLFATAAGLFTRYALGSGGVFESLEYAIGALPGFVLGVPVGARWAWNHDGSSSSFWPPSAVRSWVG